MIRIWNKLCYLFKSSIQYRLTFYFLIILVPLVTISLYANIQSQKILENHIIERTQKSMTSVLEEVDMTLEKIEELAAIFSEDNKINQILNKVDSNLLPDVIIELKETLDQMNNIRIFNPLIQEIAIWHVGSNKVLTTFYGLKNVDDIQSLNWYEDIKKMNRYLLIPDVNYYDANQRMDPIYNTRSITIMRLMGILRKNESPNVLSITIDRDIILRMLNQLVTTPATEIYLYTERNDLILTNQNNKLDILDSSSLTNEEKEKLTINAYSSFNNLKLVLKQPKNEILQETKRLQIFTIIIIKVSFLLSLIISWIVYKSISSPLSNLVFGIEQVRKGNLDMRLKNSRADELGKLIDRFNDMVKEQEHLIQNIYEKELQLLKMELNSLQSQMNPHFLYNTLDSIYWQTKNYQLNDVSEMILNLTKFMRASLYKGDKTNTIKNNINYLKYYIRIQQLRFIKPFEVIFDIDKEVEDLKILRFLIQPIIENSILHGLKSSPKNGQLIILIKVKNGHLKIQIRDNGEGMPDKRIQYVKDQLEKWKSYKLKFKDLNREHKQDLYGLWNTFTRLKLFYGEETEFIIDSEEGKGTTVTIYVPLEKCL